MSDVLIRQIDSVEALPAYRLLVSWHDGERTLVDFLTDIVQGGIWAKWRDERLFARAQIDETGTVLFWPEPRGRFDEPRIDIDAAGLYGLGREQVERRILAAPGPASS
jgi:hypothetical protein